jgi:hypothetical protein
MATALDKQLDREVAIEVIRSALETHGSHAARQIASKLDAAGVASRVDWGAMAETADALASALEASLPEARDWADASARLDTATMIRVRAGGPARRGGRFDWRKVGSLWQAKGRDGTERPDFPKRLGIVEHLLDD